MALNVFYTAIGLVSGIVIDISYGFIDPRIRMGSKNDGKESVSGNPAGEVCVYSQG